MEPKAKLILKNSEIIEGLKRRKLHSNLTNEEIAYIIENEAAFHDLRYFISSYGSTVFDFSSFRPYVGSRYKGDILETKYHIKVQLFYLTRTLYSYISKIGKFIPIDLNAFLDQIISFNKELPVIKNGTQLSDLIQLGWVHPYGHTEKYRQMTKKRIDQEKGRIAYYTGIDFYYTIHHLLRQEYSFVRAQAIKLSEYKLELVSVNEKTDEANKAIKEIIAKILDAVTYQAGIMLDIINMKEYIPVEEINNRLLDLAAMLPPVPEDINLQEHQKAAIESVRINLKQHRISA